MMPTSDPWQERISGSPFRSRSLQGTGNGKGNLVTMMMPCTCHCCQVVPRPPAECVCRGWDVERLRRTTVCPCASGVE